MATKEISQDWLAAQQDIKNDFLTCLTKNELVLMTKKFNLDVQGFSTKKLHNAPEPRLRQAVTKWVDSTLKLRRFFISFTQPFYKQMKDDDYETFILKASLSEEMTNAEKLLLLALLFPDTYQEQREQIMEQIKNGQDMFAGFVQSSLTDILTVHVKKYKDNLRELMGEFFNQHNRLDGNDLADSLEITKFFTKDYEDLEKGHVLQLIKDFELDDFELNDQDLLLLHQLALNESAYLATEAFIDYKNQLAAAQKEKATAETKANRAIKRQTDLVNQLKEKEQELKQTKTAQQQLLAEAKQETAKLQQKLTAANNDIHQLQQPKPQPATELFDALDPFFFITSTDSSLFTELIPKNFIVPFAPDKAFSDQFKSLPQNKILFIDTNKVSSKQQMKIENHLRFKKLSYKFVSGAPKRMFRQIIFYLEGDSIHETYR